MMTTMIFEWKTLFGEVRTLDSEWISIVILALCIVQMVRDYFEKKTMQKTIDRLTDKLMAKDYREYVSMQPREPVQEQPKRKAMSWYDDPNIDDDEREKH
ncbi:hypothetical protein [Paenibacillus sp. GYB003]|uniref:hypothetical protein n=1 Tax=Paenibacillus sp. GYB003 TaxID=2994392 RepID=UPI002F9639FC